MQRRAFVLGGSTALVAGFAGSSLATSSQETFEITKSDAEWRAELTEAEFLVLRREETERPHSSPLLAEDRTGVYSCAGCGLPLFASRTKFDSDTGWPSFYAPLPDAVRTRVDRTLVFITRTEVHCRRCGGHLGHVFDDGPPPTGKRYCMNGVAMDFEPESASG